MNGKKSRVTMRDPNNALTLEKKGMYKLEEIKDAHCPGTILEEATYEIDYTPRPTVRLSADEASNDAGERSEVCAGEEKQVTVDFTGQSAIARPIRKLIIQAKLHSSWYIDTLPMARRRAIL